MSSKSVVREVIFFVLIFLLFYLGVKSSQFMHNKYPSVNGDLVTMAVGTVITLLIVGIFYLAKLNQNIDSYRAFNLSPGAMCKGDPYMWQGDDDLSKMCRDMAKSPEGRCELSKYNCPSGFDGQPKNTSDWEYTSNSDSCWSGVKCKGCDVDKSRYNHPQDCNCGLCAMWV